MSTLLQSLQNKELLETLGIRVKEYNDRCVFDYSQIDSPKTDAVVMQCRGLIANKDRTQIVCRPFDRFFNLGEAPDTQTDLDFSKAVAYEKIDGSMIKIYYFSGRWEIATRGTAFGESNVNGFDLTFRDLALKAMGLSESEFQDSAYLCLDSAVTYLLEITSLENKVVTHYEGYKLHYLGARVTETGEWVSEEQLRFVSGFGAIMPTKSVFSNKDEAISASNNLGGLREGFVLWQNGRPIAKVKSDAYVTAHHIRGEGLTPKRIAELVLTGEHEEYLTYFASDKHHFEPYEQAETDLMQEITAVWQKLQYITDQKEFAKQACKYPFSAVLFEVKKKDKCAHLCFWEKSVSYRVNLLLERVKQT